MAPDCYMRLAPSPDMTSLCSGAVTIYETRTSGHLLISPFASPCFQSSTWRLNQAWASVSLSSVCRLHLRRAGVIVDSRFAGMSLWTVLDFLRNDPHSFPQVDVKYDPDSPTTPVILHLRPHLDLLFSGKHQRLHTICLKKLQDPHPPVTLRYKNLVLSSPQEVLRRVGVSRAFGPTYPGDDLRYPGVWFSFEEDSRGETLKPTPSHSEEKMQEVKRVIVSQKSGSEEQDDVLSEVRLCEAMRGDVESAIVKVGVLPASPQKLIETAPKGS